MQKPKTCGPAKQPTTKRQSQTERQNHRTKITEQNNATWSKIKSRPGRPPPNPGGYGPFSIYRCQAPNGWPAETQWTTEAAVDSHLTTAAKDAQSTGGRRRRTLRTTNSVPNSSAIPDTVPIRATRIGAQSLTAANGTCAGIGVSPTAGTPF